MFEQIVQIVVQGIDSLYTSLVSPFFSMLGHGLEVTLIKPMTLLQIPVVMQIIILAALTAAFSIFVRGIMGADKEEKKFQQRFRDLKKCQEPIGQLDDWKQREVLFRTSDNLIDEEFNTYLAQRFARQMMIYLIPIFMVLFWLSQIFPPSVPLQSRMWILGLNKMPISLIFLPSYAAVLIAVSLGKRVVRKKIGNTQSKHHGDQYGKDTCAGRCI